MCGGVLRPPPAPASGVPNPEGRDDGSLGGESVREVRTIAAALAARIYDDPQKWGIADIREDFRDDAAADTLSKLLSGAAEFTGRQTVSEWFGREMESRFHRLWSMAERARGAEKGQGPGAGPSSDEGETRTARHERKRPLCVPGRSACNDGSARMARRGIEGAEPRSGCAARVHGDVPRGSAGSGRGWRDPHARGHARGREP